MPFLRRKPRSDSVNTAFSIDSEDFPNFVANDSYLHGHMSHLRCATCATDVCLTSQIVSKGFTGRHGRAYLVSPSAVLAAGNPLCLPNTKTDTPSQRQLVTGVHTVSDVRCAFCGSMLGWKYDAAEEESQRYKVGKYILETRMVCASSDWEHKFLEGPPQNLQWTPRLEQEGDGSAIEFDSQNEDECEDLFAGVWSPSLAMRRRRNKDLRKAVMEMES